MLEIVICNGETSCKILGKAKLLWEEYEEETTVANPGNNANICLHFKGFVSVLSPTYSLTLAVFCHEINFFT